MFSPNVANLCCHLGCFLDNSWRTLVEGRDKEKALTCAPELVSQLNAMPLRLVQLCKYRLDLLDVDDCFVQGQNRRVDSTSSNSDNYPFVWLATMPHKQCSLFHV